MDIGFVCSPTYRWLRPNVELLPLPVPVDGRSNGRPVYFGDVVVRSHDRARRVDDLRGKIWAYNDRNSKSGWFEMLDQCGPDFFSQLVASGSHLESIDMVRSGEADAASIDSNVLRLHGTTGLRIIESWGPFAIQPAIIRSGVDAGEKRRIAAALLTIHERHDLSGFGFSRFVEPDEALYL
jgi:phosphonate transport system substrate-binding protein